MLKGQQQLVPGLWAKGRLGLGFQPTVLFVFPSVSRGSPDLKDLLFLFHSFFFFNIFISLFYCARSQLWHWRSSTLIAACNNFLQHIFIYLFGDSGSQLQHAESLVVACGIQFPDQGSNMVPLHWEYRVSAIVSPEKSQELLFQIRKRVKIGKLFRENWGADTLYIPVIKTGLGLFRENSSCCLEREPWPAFSGQRWQGIQKATLSIVLKLHVCFVFKDQRSGLLRKSECIPALQASSEELSIVQFLPKLAGENYYFEELFE